MASTRPKANGVLPESTADFVRSIHSGSPPDELWAKLQKAASETIGYTLFTILVYDSATATTSRMFTTRPHDQPAGARKRVAPGSRWAQRVLVDGNMLVARNKEELSQIFSEHAFLASIGCESVLNVPMRSAASAKVIGSLNFLAEAGHYDETDLDLAMLLAQLMAPVVEAEMKGFLAQPFDEAAKMESV